MGLIIATASYIDPGFKGCVTLELANVSNVPIKLYPGIRIAQLIFRETTSKKSENLTQKKYVYPIGPQKSQIHHDLGNNIFLKS